MSSDSYLDWIESRFDTYFTGNFSDDVIQQDIIDSARPYTIQQGNRRIEVTLEHAQNKARTGLEHGIWDRFKKSDTYDRLVNTRLQEAARSNTRIRGYKDLEQEQKNVFTVERQRIAIQAKKASESFEEEQLISFFDTFSREELMYDPTTNASVRTTKGLARKYSISQAVAEQINEKKNLGLR